MPMMATGVTVVVLIVGKSPPLRVHRHRSLRTKPFRLLQRLGGLVRRMAQAVAFLDPRGAKRHVSTDVVTRVTGFHTRQRRQSRRYYAPAEDVGVRPNRYPAVMFAQVGRIPGHALDGASQAVGE